MPRRHDDTQLLALIEGTLDATEATALRATLARDPALLERLDRMRDDRAGLQSLAPVEPPFDLVATVEPLMTRTMLVARPRAAWQPSRRFVAACVSAAALLGITAGLWLASDALLPRAMPDGMAAGTDGALATAPSPVGTVPNRVRSDLAGELHHDGPTATGHELFAGLSDRRIAAGDLRDPGTADRVAAFAVVVLAEEPERARDRLASAVGAAAPDAALVRNVSLSEAIDFEQAWLRSRGGTEPDVSTPRVAEAETGSRAWRERVMHRAREEAARSGAVDATLGEHLAGPDDQAPDPTTQLELSDAGYELAAAVPGTALSEVLSQLSAAGLTVRLVELDGSDVALSDDGASALDHWRRWRDVRRRAGATPSSRLVVPISIRAVAPTS